MTDETNILDQLIKQVGDESLRSRIAREVELLRGSRRFGLVFDRHLPESVRLTDYPIRKGIRVTLRDESTSETWTVVGFTDTSRSVAVLDGDGGERPVGDLVVIREFGEPIYPGLKSLERIQRGADDAPWHVVIKGENFHALQALRSTHRGKVDLIYIDPPYNTGNDSWIYNDRYVDQNDRAKSSKWLSFLERRLLIARYLLKPTGVIIVAIGDDEHHRLRMLLDQIFEPQNFLSDIVWQGGRKNDSRYVSNAADYMLVYAKDESALAAAGVRWHDRKVGVDDALTAAKEAWEGSDRDAVVATTRYRSWLRAHKSELADGVARYNSIDETGRVYFAGDLSSPNPRPNLRYDLPHPVSGVSVRMHQNGWRYSPDVMAQLISEGRVLFGTDHETTAYYKRYLDEQTEETVGSVFERDRRASRLHLKSILGDVRFPNPKDHEVLMRWIGITTPANGVIVDFFAGSGSTAEAIIRLNRIDGGTRQSILVTNNEVGAVDAKRFRAAGGHPGDPGWEANGVFEYVCRPRISTVVTGKRPDGSVYSDGLEANVEFFELTYLDPGRVRRGSEYAAVAPLMWLEGGARGERIQAVPEEGWALTQSYGVLFTIDALKPFSAAVGEAATSDAVPRVLFIITDSPAEYQAAVEQLPVGIETVQLYTDYLSNYTINVEGGAR
ncbi:site-specific DNA-methyltransferase [Nocardia cyriacigeorgica]|uniref:Site-specific DNA-methyltransferase n=1 Tax=Nocardia cyriacigeorgica TaxID=135487 RepID=A0A5R8PCM8_9NOCA|nr:site-specific DNA-methyltransferase [Nocardia cyriacigeorgica]TLG09443.1 site-specific DNA-methyltransferase [Nocardia cyriacigeorgica]